MGQYSFGSNIKQGVLLSVTMLVLCGVAYPLALTGVSDLVFPSQAKGSIVMYDGHAIGAKYIGQDFRQPYFLWGRPSAVNYNTYVEKDGKQYTLDGDEFGGVATGSANYGATNPDLADRVKKDMATFLEKNPGVKASDIPGDLMTASGSGLDPDISLQAALIQVPRIAKHSGLSEAEVKKIIEDHMNYKLLGVFGTDNVDVLAVNVAIAKKMNIKL